MGFGPAPPGTSQVAIGFLRNTGTAPPPPLEEQLDISGYRDQLLLEGGPYGPRETMSGPHAPLTEFSGSPHV